MANQVLYLWVGAMGLCLGSFLNVLILRDDRRMSIATGRSECPNCKHPLAVLDLVPVLSFLLIGGRCRYCHKPISWQYPLVELTSALLVLFSVWYGFTLHGSIWLALALSIANLLFLAVSVIDLRTMTLPVEYCIMAAVAGAGGQLLSGNLSLLQVGQGILLGAGSLAIVSYGWKLLFKQEGMGSGDLWLAGCLGAVIGFPLIGVSLLLAVFGGALFGIVLLLGKYKTMESRLPFGPFLVAGYLASFAWGAQLLHTYFGSGLW